MISNSPICFIYLFFHLELFDTPNAVSNTNMQQTNKTQTEMQTSSLKVAYKKSFFDSMKGSVLDKCSHAVNSTLTLPWSINDWVVCSLV